MLNPARFWDCGRGSLGRVGGIMNVVRVGRASVFAIILDASVRWNHNIFVIGLINESRLWTLFALKNNYNVLASRQ